MQTDKISAEESVGAKIGGRAHRSTGNDSEVWNDIKAEQIFLRPIQVHSNDPFSSGNCTRIVCISDTHGQHRSIKHLPWGDILVHAGDFSLRGELFIIQDLQNYFSEQSASFSEIICIAGNHDRILHRDYYLSKAGALPLEEAMKHVDRAQMMMRRNGVYLEDSSHISNTGLHIYGSPWTPKFCGWAFNMQRGESIAEKWRQIPTTTDILITHGPPLGRGDFVPKVGNVGCHDLMKEIQGRIKPRVNIFGHIHEGYGVSFDGTTLYVNASSVDTKYMPINHPIVIDVPHDQSRPAMVVLPTDTGMTIKDLPGLCDANGWSALKMRLDACDMDSLIKALPGRMTLFQPEAYTILCDRLRLKHKGMQELGQALRAIYAQSFPKSRIR